MQRIINIIDNGYFTIEDELLDSTAHIKIAITPKIKNNDQ